MFYKPYKALQHLFPLFWILLREEENKWIYETRTSDCLRKKLKYSKCKTLSNSWLCNVVKNCFVFFGWIFYIEMVRTEDGWYVHIISLPYEMFQVLIYRLCCSLYTSFLIFKFLHFTGNYEMSTTNLKVL